MQAVLYPDLRYERFESWPAEQRDDSHSSKSSVDEFIWFLALKVTSLLKYPRQEFEIIRFQQETVVPEIEQWLKQDNHSVKQSE